MDIRMPVMSGYETTQGIRTADHGQETVIVAMSTSVSDEKRETALSHGCNDFLRKPFREVEIFDMLHTQLGVQFVYEEEEATVHVPQIQERETLSPEACAALPDDLANKFRQAVNCIDTETAHALIEQIQVHNASLADELARLVAQYRFDVLQKLCE